MQLSSDQLDDLIDLLEVSSICTLAITEESRKGLLKIAQSERWARANLSRADEARKKAAIAEGKVQVVARMPGTYVPAEPTRLKPAAVTETDGDAILAALGL